LRQDVHHRQRSELQPCARRHPLPRQQRHDLSGLPVRQVTAADALWSVLGLSICRDLVIVVETTT
jgi:hypothetical protein